MLQIKKFKSDQIRELNEFILTVELSGSIHVDREGDFIVFYFPKIRGMAKEDKLETLNKVLQGMENKRIEEELELRYWTGKQVIPKKNDEQSQAEAKFNADKLAKAQRDLEAYQTRIRGIRKLMDEIEAGDFDF